MEHLFARVDKVLNDGFEIFYVRNRWVVRKTEVDVSYQASFTTKEQAERFVAGDTPAVIDRSSN